MSPRHIFRSAINEASLAALPAPVSRFKVSMNVAFGLPFSETKQFHQGMLCVTPSFKPFSMLHFCLQPKCVRYSETCMSVPTLVEWLASSYNGLCND